MALDERGSEQFMEPVGTLLIGPGDLVDRSFAVVDIVQSRVHGRIALMSAAGRNIIGKHRRGAVAVLLRSWKAVRCNLTRGDLRFPKRIGELLAVQQVERVARQGLMGAIISIVADSRSAGF